MEAQKEILLGQKSEEVENQENLQATAKTFNNQEEFNKTDSPEVLYSDSYIEEIYAQQPESNSPSPSQNRDSIGILDILLLIGILALIVASYFSYRRVNEIFKDYEKKIAELKNEIEELQQNNQSQSES